MMRNRFLPITLLCILGAVVTVAAVWTSSSSAAWEDLGYASYQDCMANLQADNMCNDGTDAQATYPVSGCTDPNATNYNASATQDDGSCNYGDPPAPITIIWGCTNTSSPNYNSDATNDDGSCLPPPPPPPQFTPPSCESDVSIYMGSDPDASSGQDVRADAHVTCTPGINNPVSGITGSVCVIWDAYAPVPPEITCEDSQSSDSGLDMYLTDPCEYTGTTHTLEAVVDATGYGSAMGKTYTHNVSDLISPGAPPGCA